MKRDSLLDIAFGVGGWERSRSRGVIPGILGKNHLQFFLTLVTGSLGSSAGKAKGFGHGEFWKRKFGISRYLCS